jgi:hypothetical protein
MRQRRTRTRWLHRRAQAGADPLPLSYLIWMLPHQFGGYARGLVRHRPYGNPLVAQIDAPVLEACPGTRHRTGLPGPGISLTHSDKHAFR